MVVGETTESAPARRSLFARSLLVLAFAALFFQVIEFGVEVVDVADSVFAEVLEFFDGGFDLVCLDVAAAGPTGDGFIGQ